ncbi:helix-turn-helix domain-containing protein [Flagellimonas onchidii]|uniref:helix-turn-helix domain-containing protein n=1 Tax=Flagellimonas onchidii TaxID=2562684 RepID=UPI0010A69B75|nr:helix-turn-helix transcriptional regulator [Allomuricauda onchidii]
MSFWKHILSYFKKSSCSLTHKLLLLFLPLLGNIIFVLVYGWLKLDNEHFPLLDYSQWTSLFLCVAIIRILWKHLRNNNQTSIDAQAPDKKDKYGKTGLSKSFSLELKTKLEYLMNTKQLYLQHNLKLDDIAELLDVSRHHASQVINENFKVNFYDYINAYRIENAKSKLSTNNNASQSISDIAYECGFNNRVSFYKAFKKITRITPTQFIEKKAA